ncbi:MAG: hypothetical protein RI956_489, partial [Pseudomonadota bacterium]
IIITVAILGSFSTTVLANTDVLNDTNNTDLTNKKVPKVPLILKQVSLSSSGVGYFEYEAQVSGNATLSLSVALDKVDDVLKSLVIYDAQGSIGGVSLPGLDPIAQILKQLPFDAVALESPEKLLAALRGAEITLTGKTPTRGRIVSVQTIAQTDKEPAKHQVMLMTAQGMQQFILETADNIQFEDTVLREQIQKTLLALADNRAKDTRTIEIVSQGISTRRIRVGYVSSVPIWKNTYRLTLPNTQANTAQVQGWAIIENMSGQDWTNVQLSLTSGKPVAFSQQLYKSYYNNRPHVGVELPGNIIPIADSGTFDVLDKNITPSSLLIPTVPTPTFAMAASAPKLLRSSKMMLANDSEALPETMMAQADSLTAASDIAMVQDDNTQTSYTFGLPVTVSSGRSLSIPIIQSNLPITRVALYQPTVNSQFPLAAIELNNISSNTMPAGATTIYETTVNGNQFVGDAQLKVLPANDKRYIAYALDQKISINQRNNEVYKVKRYLVKGAYLHTEYAQENTALFTVKSNYTEPHELVVEVPIQGEGWSLLDSIAHSSAGKTATHYRQKIIAQPQKTVEVSVNQVRSNTDVDHLSSFNAEALRDILNKAKYPVHQTPHTIELSSDTKIVLETMITLIEKRDTLVQQQQTIHTQIQTVRDNQQRIRDNLKSVPVKSEPHTRYMNELNKADTQDSQLHIELADNQLKQQTQEKMLQNYLATLNVLNIK